MKKSFLKIIFLTILYFSLPTFSFAEVSNIVFTTDPQTIRPDILSDAITIQSQDGSNNAFQTPETIDLEFVSTSSTGEFLGSTGKPAQKYMSKNTAKRTFYYKDSSEGDFTISINAKGRESGSEWNASQTITISSSASQATTEVKKPVQKPASKTVEAKKEEPISPPVTTIPVIPTPAPIAKPPAPAPVAEKPKEKPVAQEVAAVTLAEERQESTSTIIFESPKSESFWAKLWNFLKSIFS